jgi:O-acetylhomoserine/O-acetylserine sulfhydrylase-like pyridoxal-dependent enzyme
VFVSGTLFLLSAQYHAIAHIFHYGHRFPYTDTLKILEKWGPGVHFFGNGLSDDLPALRTLLTSVSPPILALFCEFPSNPLLRTPPLRELRELANEFGFMIIIDETIAGFVNVEVLPLADIVVSSLTKVFSGDSNVMGGRWALLLYPSFDDLSSFPLLVPVSSSILLRHSTINSSWNKIRLTKTAILMKTRSIWNAILEISRIVSSEKTQTPKSYVICFAPDARLVQLHRE